MDATCIVDVKTGRASTIVLESASFQDERILGMLDKILESGGVLAIFDNEGQNLANCAFPKPVKIVDEVNRPDFLDDSKFRNWKPDEAD